jgi:hypothetical protein
MTCQYCLESLWWHGAIFVIFLQRSVVALFAVAAALAVETIILDAVGRDRQVGIITNMSQLQKRRGRLQLQKFDGVQMTGDRLQALQSISIK